MVKINTFSKIKSLEFKVQNRVSLLHFQRPLSPCGLPFQHMTTSRSFKTSVIAFQNALTFQISWRWRLVRNRYKIGMEGVFTEFDIIYSFEYKSVSTQLGQVGSVSRIWFPNTKIYLGAKHIGDIKIKDPIPIVYPLLVQTKLSKSLTVSRILLQSILRQWR